MCRFGFPIFSDSMRAWGLPHSRRRKTRAIVPARVCASCTFSFAPQSAREACLVRAPFKRGAWSAARRTLSSFRFRHRLRSDDVSGSASPHGAPQTSLRSLRKLDCYLAAICEPGTVLPGEDGGVTRPLIRTAFAAFVLASSSRERQSHVVGPDGQPRPSGRCGCEPHRADAASCSA